MTPGRCRIGLETATDRLERDDFKRNRAARQKHFKQFKHHPGFREQGNAPLVREKGTQVRESAVN
jgi:hypothetical protein